MKTATIEKIIETRAPRIDHGLEIGREEYESRKRLGAKRTGFPTIVCSGPRGWGIS